MTPSDFAKLCRSEKDTLLTDYLDTVPEAWVGKLIKSMGLSEEQLRQVREVLDTVLADTFYRLLLALDGAASLGGAQQTYHVVDETGAVLTGNGALEAAAWEAFHGDNGERAKP